MNETVNNGPNRAKVVHTLAVVGFIALIGSGMALAVYSTRYVPDVVTRLGGAAGYLGSVFTPAEPSSLSVVPTASSTIISFGETPVPTTTTTVTPTESKSAPTAGERTNQTIQISGATTPSPLNGLPDLVTTIDSVGYLTTTSASAESFVASSTVPSGAAPAFHFTIKNIGTNSTGAWRWSASIPTSSAYLQESQPQMSLKPGESIEYWLGFDHAAANKGLQTISVTANFDKAIKESNSDNNTVSANVTISY